MKGKHLFESNIPEPGSSGSQERMDVDSDSSEDYIPPQKKYKSEHEENGQDLLLMNRPMGLMHTNDKTLINHADLLHLIGEENEMDIEENYCPPR